MFTESQSGDTARATLRVGGLAIGAYIAGSILVVVTIGLLESVGIRIVDRPARRLLLGTVLLQGVAFGGVAIGYLIRSNKLGDLLRIHAPSWKDAATIIVGTVGLVGFVMIISVILETYGISVAQNNVVSTARDAPMTFLLLVPLSILLVGPGEELLYRGVVQGTLADVSHPIRAVILASAIFSLIHIFSLTGDGKILYLGIVFVQALVLGGTYLYTSNLVVPSLIHGFYNAIQFAFAYLSAIGLI
ncbi:CPBP family intramembrane glutamic endopeptidase [Halomarina pelagica]|uniref:CPBP family intramembrane glutamic endopeptidase n=1 Tax=Halomarina pelagica TaxID=2961599 RepID=UPI0020C4FABB|nr:type II CAAX endopeptidase family protein [Halomarina sp. BND7]